MDSDTSNTSSEPELSDQQIKDKLELTTSVRDMMYLYNKLTSDQKIQYQDNFTARKEMIESKNV